MADSLAVIVGERRAGSLVRLGVGQLRFDYDDDYRRDGDATPLSVSMPLPVASHTDTVVSPWMWGLLPDDEAVVRRWAKTFRVSASSVFSLMASPVGEDCAGAVRFATPERLDDSLIAEGGVEWLSVDDVEMRLRDLREDRTAWLGRSATGQFSLAGAQASALPYGEHEKALRFAMKIGGDYRVYPYRNTWPVAASELGLDPGALVKRVIELADRAPAAFAGAAAAPDVAALESTMPARLVDLVTDRVLRCRRLVA